MKLLSFVVLSFCLSNAQAFDVCSEFVACGNYEATSLNDQGEPLVEQIILAKVGELAVSIQFVSVAGQDSRSQSFILSFEPNGSFTATIGDSARLAGNGVCGKGICSFGLVPMENKNVGVYGISGIVRFLESSLEYNKFAVSKAGQFPSSLVYSKK